MADVDVVASVEGLLCSPGFQNFPGVPAAIYLRRSGSKLCMLGTSSVICPL